MSQLSPKERLFRTIKRKSIDRKPVICPGGMMNAAVVDVMRDSESVLPAAHSDALLMSALAQRVASLTGFENIGVPFCMTIEPEILGAEIDFGTLECEPKIARELFPSVSAVEYRDIPALLEKGRVETIANAAAALSGGDLPLICSLTGPISTAASIVDPMTFLKELRKKPSEAHRVLDYVTDFLIAYALTLLESGADIISIADPTATGEILGPKMFSEFAVRYINKLTEAVQAADRSVILHICGNMNSVKQYLPEFYADVISTDAMVNLRGLKEEYPDLLTMGNLSTYLLESGKKEAIEARTEHLIKSNIDIIAPACGLSTSSPMDNLQAFTGAVKS